MRFGLYVGVLAFTVLGSPAAPQKPALSWTSQQAETLRHFRALVQIDTSNPPGNEARIVEYLEKVLASDGIPSTRFALDPNRPNLVARLKGNGAKRPVLMLAHTDVVGVQRDKWPVDPFGAVLRDGYVWGRGTTDDKDNLAANLMTFLLIKRSGAGARPGCDLPGRIRRRGRSRPASASASWSIGTSMPSTRNSPLPRGTAPPSRMDAFAPSRLRRPRRFRGVCGWSRLAPPATARCRASTTR